MRCTLAPLALVALLSAAGLCWGARPATPPAQSWQVGAKAQVGQRALGVPALVPPDLRVLVPAYFYPVPGSAWGRLNVAAAAHPGRVAAIGNPNNGPGGTVDPAYTAAFGGFRSSGGLLLGYVYTSYGARPLAEVEADIDAWLQLYAVDGFFLDEMSNVVGAAEAYYQALFDFIQARLPQAPVVGNPGVSTSPSYLVSGAGRVVSTLCIFEDSTSLLGWGSDPWVKNFPRQNFYALPHTVQASQWQAVVDHAFRQNCGWIYATDDTLPNPWDTLPRYFELLVAYVATTY